MRTKTNILIEMMNQGLITPLTDATMALAYMSEADVANMMRCNDILEEEDQDDGQPDEAQEWYDFDPDC